MKTFLAVIPLVSCVLLFPCDADAARPLQPRPTPPVPEAKPWTPKPNSAHETTWQSVTLATNPVTMKVTEIQHEYVELGIGLNVPQPDGTLLRANPSFALTPNGAEANTTLHRVTLAPNINADGGAVQVTTPEGVVIRSAPLSFGYLTLCPDNALSSA